MNSPQGPKRPDEHGACGACRYWSLIPGTAAFGKCQNWHGDFFGSAIPPTWGCPAWEAPDPDEPENTPVEIPRALHRKRTQGD